MLTSKPMYGSGNSVDREALASLLRFDSLISGRWDPEGLGGLSEDELEHAVEAGLMFRPNRVIYDHDTAVTALCDAVKAGKPAEHAALFLASLSSQRRDYRVGLPAFAIALHFPKHAFEAQAANPYCAVCGMTRDKNSLARSEANSERFKVGGVIGTAPQELAFYLRCSAQLEPVKPNASDLEIFGAILEAIESAKPKDALKGDILKTTKKLLGKKVTTEEAKALLETLGYCGILETAEHPGFLKRYANPGTLPRKTHSSDWRYPADFWLGKDGIQRKALSFWFPKV